MNRLQLATLLSWAGESGLHGRKRLQKVVFFLQSAGCQLDCRYTLHHFGPYSRDVADACDEMVAAGLVNETGGPQAGDMQYTYALKPETRALLAKTPNASMQQFEELGRRLIQESVWPLELGSTILYFYRQTDHPDHGGDWELALNRACEFKKVSADTEASQEALRLAQRVQAPN